MREIGKGVEEEKEKGRREGEALLLPHTKGGGEEERERASEQERDFNFLKNPKKILISS